MGGTIRLSPLHAWHASNALNNEIIERAQQLAGDAGEFDVVDYLEPKLYFKYLAIEQGERRAISERALVWTGVAVVQLLDEMGEIPPNHALPHLREMFLDWELQRREGTAIPRIEGFW